MEATQIDVRHAPALRKYLQRVDYYKNLLESKKVSETSKETVTIAEYGSVIREHVYKMTTSTSEKEIRTVGRFVRYLRFMFILLIISAIGYYLYAQKEENEIEHVKYLTLELQDFWNKISTTLKQSFNYILTNMFKPL